MDFISAVLIIFIVLETSNVVMLYFIPGTKKGNAMGTFKSYKKYKDNKEIFPLVSYLVNWVAGTKLIFIVLLIGVVILGTPEIKIFSVVGLILSVSTFYIKLYPAIKKMDSNNHITPKGYSKTLGIMIAIFILLFIIALVLFLLFQF